MLDLNEALNGIIAGTDETIKNNGFEIVKPENTVDDLPVTKDGEHSCIDFKGEKGKIRIEFFGNQVLLFYTAKTENATDEDLIKASVNYFNLEEFNQKDLKSLCNELNDTISDKFGGKQEIDFKKNKMPTPVSKSAAKSGAQAYDGNTLASRLASVYPELKEPYKANYEKHGEFLPEEFFAEHGAEVVINVIKSGNKTEIKRLFKILNEIYENGTSDTQGLIAVTILGEMNNDEAMCETAKEFMCDDMREPVLLINKFFATAKGKKVKEKLKNPPPYKPKKQKQPGLFSQMMAQGAAQNGGMPPM